MEDRYVKISVKELMELLESWDKLNKLESLGVDNWEGYGLSNYDGENDEDFEWTAEKILEEYEEVK